MNNSYYPNPNLNVPNTFECHVDSIIVYIASLLFTDEFLVNPQKAYNRILISDVNAGANIGLGDAIQFMKQMNDNFPFVVYNVGEPQRSQYGTTAPTAVYQLLYVPEIDSYVRAYPVEVPIQMIAFFTDSLDHRIAYTKLGSEESALIRLYTPVMFGETHEAILPFDIKYEFTNGNYASQFEQYLAQGRIWDIVMTLTIRYYEYLLDDVPDLKDKNIRTESGIYPPQLKVGKVKDVLMRLFSMYGTTPRESVKVAEQIIPDDLKVISTSPVNDQTKVSTGTEISIKFNNTIKPDTVNKGIILKPYFDNTVYYSVDYKTVNIKCLAASGLAPKTLHQVTINKDLKDENDRTLEQEYILNFTTK